MVEPTTSVEDAAYERIRATDEFDTLKRRYRGFVVPITIGFMVWYLLYVVCSNWAPELMNTRLFGNINVALAFGLLQFVSTFLIAWLYARYAATKMDPIADRLRAEYDEEISR